ncbi:MAG: ion transporter [Actinobacteria bacterium]|nr:ion transporter [Actinomycetota bacterium]
MEPSRIEQGRETVVGSFKRQVYFTLEDPEEGCSVSKAVSIFLFVLIIANVILILGETGLKPDAEIRSVFRVFDIFSLVVFTVEYLLRVWTADLLRPELSPVRARFRYVFSLMGIVDLFAFLPSYIPLVFAVDARVIKSIRLIRLVRIFKFTRYMEGLASIGRVFRERANQVMSLLMVLFLLLVISSVLMYEVENPVQPEEFDSVFAGVYWAIATITTTGYGDLVPITVEGRILGFIVMLLSIAIATIPAGILSAGFVVETQRAHKERQHPISAVINKRGSHSHPTYDQIEALDKASDDYRPYDADDDLKYCPHCGRSLK